MGEVMGMADVKARVEAAAQRYEWMRAQEQLVHSELWQLVDEVVSEGTQQNEIARMLSVSQPFVSQMVSRARAAARNPDAQILRVVQQRAAGEITTDQMLETLAAWEYAQTPRPPEFAEWDVVPRVPGGAHVLGDAYDRRLLSREEYDELITRIADRQEKRSGDTVAG